MMARAKLEWRYNGMRPNLLTEGLIIIRACSCLAKRACQEHLVGVQKGRGMSELFLEN
jgi:hypothetical protein